MEDLKSSINKARIPKHIAIIMDGNGRWAKEQGQDRIYGHDKGVDSVRDTVEACAELGVEYLTLYAFSSENWSRPTDEVNALMELLVATLQTEIATLNKNNIRLRSIGNIKSLPEHCQEQLKDSFEQTSNNTGLNLVLALNYSGKWDVVNAIKLMAQDVENDQLDADKIDECKVKQYLTTSEIPDPELLIRTSGEYRISNFLLWELAYTELYFCSKNWPDFTQEELYKALIDFQNRERRFGKVSEQISK